MAEAAALFESIGLDPKTALNVSRNAKLSAALREVVAEAGAAPGCGKVVGNLLYSAAAKARSGSCLAHLLSLTRLLSFLATRCAIARRWSPTSSPAA